MPAATSGSVTRKSATSAPAPQTSARSSAVASPRRARARCAQQRRPKKPEVRGPRPRRPLRGEQRVLARDGLEPRRVHRGQRSAKWSGRHRRDQHDRGDRARPAMTTRRSRAIEDGQRHAHEHRKPQRGGDVHGAAIGDQGDREPRASPKERGDREHADAERQHARKEVRLERIDAGPRNPVSHRERRGQRRDGPWAAIDAGADEHEAGPDHQQRREVARPETTSRARVPRCARGRRAPRRRS